MSVLYGYDYGTKLKIMLLADTEFPSLIANNLLGLGSEEFLDQETNKKTILLVMVFRDKDSAIECFSRFIRWCGPDRNGEGFGLSIINFGCVRRLL